MSILVAPKNETSQKDLDVLKYWSLEGQLMFHPAEIRIVKFCEQNGALFMGGAENVKTDEIQVLGIIFANILTWNTNIRKKLSSVTKDFFF